MDDLTKIRRPYSFGRLAILRQDTEKAAYIPWQRRNATCFTLRDISNRNMYDILLRLYKW